MIAQEKKKVGLFLSFSVPFKKRVIQFYQGKNSRGKICVFPFTKKAVNHNINTRTGVLTLEQDREGLRRYETEDF
jgi:hypothetical protein